MIVQAVLFYIFAALAVASGVMVVALRNPVHSVLFLIVAFFNVAALFLLIGAEFLAMILVIVYVGAVAVLFLFVVMMLNIDFLQLRSGFVRYLPVGAAIGVVLLAERHDCLSYGWALPVQHSGARQHSLHPLPVCISGGGINSARSDDRGDRVDLAAARRHQAAIDIRPAGAHARGDGRSRQSAAGEREQLMLIDPAHYLTVAAILFTLGIFGIFLNRKNVIIMLMSIELMLLAVTINFVAFSVFLNNLIGQAFAMFELTVATAEAAIGLAILVVYFRNRGTIRVEDINMMKG